MSQWEIKIYQRINGECPFQEFLNIVRRSGRKDHLANIKFRINNMRTQEAYRTYPMVEKVEGYDNIWELRQVKAGYRIFFMKFENIILLLCGEKKMPKKEFKSYLRTVNGYVLDYIGGGQSIEYRS